MASDNAITIVGNMTRDPEIRQTSLGETIATMGLAWNNRYRKDDEWVEEPHFFDVVAYGQTADNIAKTITRGMRVVVYGRLNLDQWTDQKDGSQRQKVKIVASEVSPSLRWAKAEVERNPRADTDET